MKQDPACSSPATSIAAPKRLSVLLSVALALLAVLPFLPAVDGAWIFDDAALIANNRLIRSWEHAGRWLTGQLFDAPIAAVQLGKLLPFYRPLVIASYALDYQWGNGAPWAFHITNLVLHAGVVALVFRALLRWGISNGFAFWAALIFAWHPARAENVAWISGRPDLLVSLFLLATLEVSNCRSLRRMVAWPAMVGLSVLAFLSKELAVLLPIFVVFEEHRALGWPRWTRGAVQTIFVRSLWAVTLAAGYVVVRLTYFSLGSPSQAHLSPSERLQLVLETCGRLLELAIFPRDLTMFASRMSVATDQMRFHLGYVLLGAAAVAGMIVLLVRLWKARAQTAARQRLLHCCLLVLCLLPVLQLKPIGISVVTQARFWYLPLLPGLALVVLFLPQGVRWLKHLGVVSAVLFCVLTYQRSHAFVSDKKFWKTELAANPAVPEVIHAQLRSDITLGGAPLAMRRAVCGFGQTQSRYSSRQDALFLGNAFDVGLSTLGDGAPSLGVAAQFIHQVLAGRDAEYSDRFVVHLKATSSTAGAMRAQGAVWRMREAALWARQGEVERALSITAEAVRGCPRCDDIAYQAARLATLYDQEELAGQYARDLGPMVQNRLANVRSLIQSSRARSGVTGAFELAGVGRILDDPALSYRAVLPYAERIERAAPEDVQMTWALIAGQAGDLDRALMIRSRLSASAQARLDELGFPKPIPDRHQAFVAGGCALPSEL